MAKTIITYTGQLFDYEADPRTQQYPIEDIAHGLSNACRFAGQCQRFYSVAQHSVLVSLLLPRRLALAGLMHDGSEAYLCDIPKPAKDLLPDYRRLEAGIQSAIYAAYLIELDEIDEAALKTADLRALKLERDMLVASNPDRWHHIEGLEDVPQGFWWVLDQGDSSGGEALFLGRYRELTQPAVS